VTVPPADWIQAWMVATAGGTPVWTAENRTTGWLKVGIEQVAAWIPSASSSSPTRRAPPTRRVDLPRRPGWQATRAGRSGSIRPFPRTSSPGTRATRAGSSAAVARATLHPERFPGFDLRAEVTAFYRDLYGIAPSAIESLVLPRLADVTGAR